IDWPAAPLPRMSTSYCFTKMSLGLVGRGKNIARMRSSTTGAAVVSGLRVDGQMTLPPYELIEKPCVSACVFYFLVRVGVLAYNPGALSFEYPERTNTP
ncbi:MAG TPA: hypothetical protein PL024_12110, partial [Thauera sp.]|nr:hypothetical protein [Thauera sp.]